MADLSYRFDKYTEKYDKFHLDRIREFARTTPLPDNLMVEIGSNRARFLSRLAEENPDRFLLGIEWREKHVDYGCGVLADRGIENAKLIQADANHALPILIDEEQIGDLFIPFPDPWWKIRHRKRRIIQPEFLDLVAEKMKDGGTLWIRTDVGSLADDMQEIIDAHPAFEPLPLDEFPKTPFPRTTREVTILKRGLPVHLLYYRRRPRSK